MPMTVADRRKLDATHDAVTRIEAKLDEYSPASCAQRGVKLQVLTAGLLILWCVVIAMLIIDGNIPDIKRPRPPTSIADHK